MPEAFDYVAEVEIELKKLVGWTSLDKSGPSHNMLLSGQWPYLYGHANVSVWPHPTQRQLKFGGWFTPRQKRYALELNEHGFYLNRSPEDAAWFIVTRVELDLSPPLFKLIPDDDTVLTEYIRKRLTGK